MVSVHKIHTIHEIEELSALAKIIFNEVYAQHVSADHITNYLKVHQSPEAISLQLEHNYTYYFIKREGRLIGYFALIYQGDFLELSKLYLKKRERGKGVGDYILEWIEDYAEDLDVKEIELLVLRQNEAAIKFYQAHGFILSELVSHHFETGDYEENYKMYKKIKVRTTFE